MAFGIGKARITPIAIDFGVDTLKMLQISVSDQTTQLIAAASVVVPEAARKDSAARYAFLGDAVKELLRQQPFKGRRVMCGIPAFQTLVNTYELQCGENDNIDQQVSLHLQTVLEKDPARMVIRNQRVGSVVREGSTKQRVICMAAGRSVVMRYLELAAAAKLEVVGMHSEPICIARGFSELYNRRDQDKAEARCFIDIGSGSTKLVIIKDKQILLARNLAVSGDEMTRKHGREHKRGFDEARLARIREASNDLEANPFGNASSAAPVRAEAPLAELAEDNGPAVALAEMPAGQPARGLVNRPGLSGPIDELLDTLIEDIRMIVRYHDSVCPGTPIQRTVLLGGEANQPQIAQAIAYAIGVPTYIGDPLARLMRTPGLTPVGVDVNQPQPGWAVPLGLCLSEANL